MNRDIAYSLPTPTPDTGLVKKYLFKGRNKNFSFENRQWVARKNTIDILSASLHFHHTLYNSNVIIAHSNMFSSVTIYYNEFEGTNIMWSNPIKYKYTTLRNAV